MAGSWDPYAEAIVETSDRGEMVVLPEPGLRRFCSELLVAHGVPGPDAELTTDVFIQSDLRGEDSHGVRLLLQVIHRIKAGGDVPRDESVIVSDRKATALIDARRSLGQPVAARAMRLAIDKAREFGIGMVGVRNANSYTSAKYYPLMAASQGMIGITYTNSGVQLVTPHGGRKPLVGTNPLSIAAPALGNFPFVLDMAISPAMEKIFQAFERDEKIPAGWAIDVDGHDTENPADALASRSLLPWGGHKGFGLGLAHEILTCVLMDGPLFGGGATGFLPHDGPMNVSQTFQAIDIEHFVPLDRFQRQMDRVISAVHASGPRPGFDYVYYPGEKGFLEEKRRLRDGVPIQRRVVSELNALAAMASVAPLSQGHA